MQESVGFPIAFMAGVLSFLSPCVLPLVPSYLSFVTGMSLEDLQEGFDRRRVLTHAALFVSGFTLIFVLLGASATFVGSFLLYNSDWIARIGGAIIIVFGLHLMGVFQLLPLLKEKRVHLGNKPAGYVGTVAVGVAFGAGWTPCIGPVLGAILTMAASQEHLGTGMLLLFVYSMGLAIPFLLAALALERFLRAFTRARRYLPLIQKGAGLLLVLLGVLLVTGSFVVLAAWLNRYTPEFLLERL
ncbi:MAG: cytochrome c biogenesis protein CcdA [Gemmatimonadota bacterium]|nr:cytochrome c biogenesis protein CcdA [Gemmatimonadota bacterium]MDE2679047.1 cytochrome c biogenesis protein CcdA [Gemmatimonadota bacterium]MXX34981.1 cytochrome c biogenesis protein CcdA [Gemmatimonadota bacterium]MYA12917.1 cytochrome c biogenesis protein CcdA [Gemmatimonadota bacterium]MYD13594.1 cytochrome c biogenesis protein CcdA [Gemmatimonadota bacterium]